ncbi:diguanylate cyclase [Bosea sp. (in: a-proteobacteria)]|jgi:diguanylate cyclase (GGDEF)-like protein|uniref:GGDEF domain-containing protein n=1 Tax=Bosea sp. (in: a-proteobacteria) TaxID=1871050 RepID=UPI00273594AF|nr:sensor domain-containing diguanylate cyclase [Bosea sp. (in: a-proteobacteria)]MDP3410644.1 sensor domain-containing diguanylate cyclase [Bosea sp. (in: a-proteobacteria)]
MYQEVHTENIEARAHAAEVAELLERFRRSAQGPAGVPYEDFCNEVMADFGADLMILAPTGDGDYLHVHYGREIVRYAGGSRMGERVSTMTPQVARFTIACCDRALADGKPSYTIHRSLKTVRVCLWERLVMPATSRDGGRFLLVFSRPLQFREELLTTVLDTSPSGIVALRAIRDHEGHIERTVIITANRRAAALAGCEGEGLLDSDAQVSLPFLAEATVWRRCLYAIELRRTDMIEASFTSDGRTIWLQIAVAPLGDGLVLTITDISDLIVANQTLQSRAATLALEIGRERATRRALSQEIGQREEREQELRRLAETDPLTALLNRRSFTEKAHAAIHACEAAGTDISLIVVDLDHFKAVNDSFGHPAGDAVIRAFADLLLGQVRNERDLVGRFGGEEFAILLPGADLEAALRIALRIQDILASRRLPVSETLALQVSASLGIATHQKRETLSALIERADKALYRAKHDGRRCIRIADPDLSVAA